MNKYASNPLRTRRDVAKLASDLIAPLVDCLSPGKARLNLGNTGAVYDSAIAGMEGFSRVLWALVPMLAGSCPEAEQYWPLWREGILHGTDPENEEYWGDIGPFDQRMVEMAVMGMALCMIPERFYFDLPEDGRKNLYNWLNQINQYDMPLNNWLFFRVLVNIGFMHVGLPVDEARLASDFEELEGHYCGDGWYYDKLAQRDYYTLWAFHYYGMVYAKYMADRDPERSKRFLERSRLILPRFAAWFDDEGRGLPYGRSQAYRFAQGAFFSACALSGVTLEADAAGRFAPIGWGELKGLLLRNLRWWMGRPIFDRDGVLTIGYGYPNLIFAEGYNAPGSPYWAMKVFAVLALPEEHPFWQAEEAAWPAPEVLLDEQARQLIVRAGGMVTAYTAGNHAFEHAHEDEKYEKFAYSTAFAYSVAKEAGTLRKGAFDSMLALRRPGELWHGRSGFDAFELTEREADCTWRPLNGVQVETRVIPCGCWHVRCHVIRSEYELEAAEGAFAVPSEAPGKRPCDAIVTLRIESTDRAAAHGPLGSTALFALAGYERGEVLQPEPNTNLIHPRTLIPTLHARIQPGETRLVCAVYASTGDSAPDSLPEEVLEIAKQCL